MEFGMAISIDLNGIATTGVDTTTNYDQLPETNPTTPLFSAATVSITGNGASSLMNTLTLTLSDVTGAETLSSSISAADLASLYGIKATYNGGVLTFAQTVTGNGHSPSATDWTTILNSVQFTNTADVPLPTAAQTITIVGTDNNGDSYTSNGTTVGTETVQTICFMAGTMIRTPGGEAAVET